ncbi:L-asparaginase precursor [Paramyrothecium foliicola]|nr:L-asparaginase precursor [Paramyrothecium foliicola]
MGPESVAIAVPPLIDETKKYGASSGTSARGRKVQDTSKSAKPTRKRTRSVEDGSPDQRDAKRARGRPRLNTQDETAADTLVTNKGHFQRRRTQIRLAQRAYRNRKDNTIINLEQKVKDLEDVNKGMSKALSSFYEMAVAQGILNSTPEAARRLKDLSNTFSRMESKLNENDEQSSQTSSPDEASNAVFDEADAQLSTSSSSTVDHSPKTLGPSNAVADVTAQAAPEIILPGFSEPPLGLSSLQYEVIAQPTPDNASYPFYIDLQPQLQFTPNFDFQTPLLTQSLPMPASYSAHERSFGRRLHRITVEAGLHLASMPNPPIDQFAAVFGFCLLFEGREAIIDRLATSVGRKRDEGMCHWRSPFTNLGGAGTYSFNDNQVVQAFESFSGNGALPTGNPTDHEFYKTPHSTGYSMGPFDARTQAVADEFLTNRKYMRMPNFEGSFFDPADVDYYLTSRNIFIPPNADFVDAEIDIRDFQDPPKPDECVSSEFLKPERLKMTPGAPWSSQNPQGFGVNSTDSGSGPAFAYCALFANSDWQQVESTSRFKVTINVQVLIDDTMDYPSPGSSTPEFKPRVIIHGGAGNIDRRNFPQEKYHAFRKSLTTIILKTNDFMTSPPNSEWQDEKPRKAPSALEVATYAVTQLEDDGLFNCGHGAVFTRDGINELEASVMVSRGFKKRCVGVTGLRRVRNPILLARRMLEHGEEDLAARRAGGPGSGGGELDVPSAQGHTILHGKAAEQLAGQYGLELVDPGYFFTQQRWDEHMRALERESKGAGLATWAADEYLPQGTTGAVVLDGDGVICAATSTGGLTNKLTGRIGDTPVPGAGFWAEEWDEAGDPTAAGSAWCSSLITAMANSSPSVILAGSLKGFLADCLPTPFKYTPVSPHHQRDPFSAAKSRNATRSIGISGTGNGDSFLRTDAARSVAAMARWKPEDGASALGNVAGPGGTLQRSAGERWRRTGEGEGGMIGIECVVVRDGHGRIVETRSEVLQSYNCGGMYRAWIDDEGHAVMSIWSNGSADEGWACT